MAQEQSLTQMFQIESATEKELGRGKHVPKTKFQFQIEIDDWNIVMKQARANIQVLLNRAVKEPHFPAKPGRLNKFRLSSRGFEPVQTREDQVEMLKALADKLGVDAAGLLQQIAEKDAEKQVEQETKPAATPLINNQPNALAR